MESNRRDARLWARVWVAVKYPVRIFLLVRVALSLVAAVSLATAPAPPNPGGNFVFQPRLDDGLAHYLLEPWNRWDTQWYLKIAAQGYAVDDGSLGFYPLYPLLVRAVGTLLGGQWLLAALIVSNLAALGCYVMLYWMVERELGAEAARQALLWLAVFPSGFFLFAGYTESLFLLAVLLALDGARAGHWARAGLASALAMLTRAPGVMLVVPLLFEWVMQVRRGRAHWRDFLTLAAASSGGAAFWLYLALISGGADPISRGYASWAEIGFPGWNLVLTVQMLFSGNLIVAVSNAVMLVFALLFFVLIGAGVRRVPLVWTVYAMAIFLPPLMSVHSLVPVVPAPDIPRHGLVAFPIFVTLALTPWRWRALPIVFCAVVQMWFVASFARWGWVS